MTARARYWVDADGQFGSTADTTGMAFPMACGACGHIHDTAKVTVIARYTDCSVWRCPRCNVQQDDRVGFNGPGQARRIR